MPVEASGAGELALAHVTGIPCFCSFFMLSSHVLVVFGSCSRRLAARNRSFRRTGCVCACRPSPVGVVSVRALDHPFFRDFFFCAPPFLRGWKEEEEEEKEEVVFTKGGGGGGGL